MTANGIAVQAFKTWCRSFPRKENRVWHDALNGVSIPQDQKFRLQTPKYGLLEIDFPYDGLAPWSEWIHCGHSIRYEAPQGAIVNPWSGGTVQLSASKWAQDQETELTLEQTTAVELAVNEAGLSQFLTAKPLQRLNFTNVKTGDFGADSSAGWTAPPEFVQLKQSYPWIVVKPVTRMDKLPLGNETLRPGLSPGVAVMDKGTLGFMKGVFVHELGHHVIYEAGIEIEQLIKNAYGIGKPITQYASANYHEYFCESLAAYTYYRKELQKYDLVGYNLVQEVLKRLR